MFKQYGHDLRILGINEYAYNFENIMRIIEYVKISNGIILGGDVYKISSNSIEGTYDSWFYDIERNNDSDKSIKKSIDYITNYNKVFPNNLYTIVVIDYITSQIR